MSDFTALIPSNAVEINGERAFTTSLMVADVFGKQHKHVLRDIDNLDCSDEFRGTNFGPTFREVPGPRNTTRQERYFELTKNGFIFLVMGYRGQKAAQFKEAYIRRFDEMESQLRQGTPIDTTPLEDGVHRVLEVEFQGDTLYLIDANGTPYVHAESIRAGSRLPWYPTRHELFVLYEPHLKTLAVRFPDGAVVPMHECLPLRKLPGWLAKGFGRYGRFDYQSPEYLHLRAYHDACDDALWDAWDAYQAQIARSAPMEALLSGRWIASFDHQGRMTFTPVDPRAFVCSAQEWAGVIASPEFPREQLPEVLNAAQRRMQGD